VRLHELMNNPGLRASLAARGRARALERYTQKRVAEETVAVYRSL
jgi:glycosyltransferase involved in cell wall biosynthesis